MASAETNSETNGPGEVTRLLYEVRDEETGAFDALYALVYEELRKVARGALREKRGRHTLQPTALVNEAYLKLASHAQAPRRTGRTSTALRPAP